MEPNGPDPILTTGEAATLCGVSRSTLRRAVAQGHLRAWHTPGKHLRFSREACDEFARSLGRTIDVIGRPHQDHPYGRRSTDVPNYGRRATDSASIEAPVRI